jgi:acetylornithine deacetylase/succinyl-diaminopimelate desuccinylase-like protein
MSNEQLEKYKETLAEFLAFRSVSTSKEYEAEIAMAVDWLKVLFERETFKVQVFGGYGNPIVFASLQADPKLETCLVYGHYDVQPADRSDGWSSEPFKLTERDGRLYGRGVVDNKGQLLIHALTIFRLAGQRQLGYNIKFIIEGNEETGSGDLGQFIKDRQDLLAADFALLSDGEFGEFPVIEAGFRGGFNATLTLATSHTDLHSGIYSSAAPNAAHELAKILSTFYDHEHKIRISGFYDDVDDIEEEILAANRNLPFNPEAHKRNTGNSSLLLEPGYDFYTQIGLRPAIQVTGLQSGYTGEGYRNSIAARASAKINFRLVKSQDPHKIAGLFEKHILENLPNHVKYRLEFHDFHEGVKLGLNNDYTRAAIQAISRSHQRRPAFKFCGGGLPVVTHFDQLLDLPTLSVPLANDDCAMHAVDENFRFDYLDRGLAFSQEFFKAD